MRQVDVHEAETKLSELLEAVERGERVLIARSGRPVAVLSACKAEARRRQLGQFRGQCRIPENFDDLPDDVLAFEGDAE